jgi:putative aminopeptidase FrvX
MDKTSDLYSFIQDLAKIHAPSGLEEARAQCFINYMKQFIVEDWLSRDNLGNVIIKIPPSSTSSTLKGKTNSANKIPRILLIAHLDEIGGTIYKIQKNGRLLFTKRGGYEVRWLISHQVQILTLKGDWINGIILGRTPHAIPSEARTKVAPNVQELEIYIGAESDEQAKKIGIHSGAPFVFENKTMYLNPLLDPDLVVSNSFDDIVGLGVLFNLAARFGQQNPFQAEIILAGVVREEIGREGSLLLGRSLSPDLCIGLDFAVIESDKSAIDCGGQLKGGPMVVWVEAEGRGVFDYNLAKEFVQIAENEKIPYQNGVFEFYGSDAGILQKELGIKSVLIGIPLLAGHNNYEIIALGEIGKAADLIWKWFNHGYK